MEVPNLFEGLAEFGLRGSVDMRPTLIRVLTDLYVQKLKHTADEDRHYTELALRLLDGVDAQTRAAISAKLAHHLSPPLRVVQYLVADLPDVAAPLREHAVLRAPVAAELSAASEPSEEVPAVMAATEPGAMLAPGAEPDPEERHDSAGDIPGEENRAEELQRKLDAATARQLNTLFFASTAEERRLILLNLHIAAPLSAGEIAITRDPSVAQRLEAAALGSYREDLAKQFRIALRISHEQARRITRDDLGEPLVVAVKALCVPRDVFHRILMFANPAIGHSVERVQSLAALFDEMPLPAAEGMVAIWQSLEARERSAKHHQPVHWDDRDSSARPAMSLPNRLRSAAHAIESRSAS